MSSGGESGRVVDAEAITHEGAVVRPRLASVRAGTKEHERGKLVN